jgi:tRNA threonylcarbamoyladenosine biosynthesis protein TsaE
MKNNLDETITNSAEEMKELAKVFAKGLKKPSVIALYGSLGSGKTTFAQGFAQGLGIKKRILSPTFIFIRPYQLKGSNLACFYHVDLYRLNSEKDAEAIGLKEVLTDKKAVVVIEWPEKIAHLLPENTIKLKLEISGENKRKVSVI